MAANLTIVTTDVHPVEITEQFTGQSHETVDRGEVVYYVAATGLMGLADKGESAPLNRPAGIAFADGYEANITITCLKKGLLDVGDALSGLNYGAPLYLSDTAGKIYDSDPGSSTVLGYVVPAPHGTGTADKLISVDL